VPYSIIMNSSDIFVSSESFQDVRNVFFSTVMNHSDVFVASESFQLVHSVLFDYNG
jgi:hypothetical protein